MVQFARITAARRDYKPLAQSAIELAGRGVTTIVEAMAAVSGISDDIDSEAAISETDTPIAPGRVLSLLS